MIISIACKFEEKEVAVISWKNPTKDFQKNFFFLINLPARKFTKSQV